MLTVDSIARSRCDPPLYVICHPLRTVSTHVDGKARGVLLVEVPPSPSAPHMVDHRYYGRSDTTNYQLADNDVVRLHAIRTARQATAEQLIAGEIARDPVTHSVGQLSHLYVVAQPSASPPDLLTSLIGTPALNDLIREVPNHVPAAGSLSPNWGYLSNYGEPRAEGSGFCSYALSGRQFISDVEGAKEHDLLDIEVQDNGRVTLFCGRASDGASGAQHVVEPTIVALTRCLVTLAGQLGATAGYGGRWLLAAGINDLSGKLSSSAIGFSIGRAYPPFSAHAYVQGTEAGTVELLEQSGAVTGRLVGRLLRGLGSQQNYQYGHLLSDSNSS